MSMAQHANIWRDMWLIPDDLHFYNHGSFGACPKPLLEVQTQYRTEMERDPVHFMLRTLPGLMQDARTIFADFLHCNADDLAIVNNATTAVNTVLKTIDFQPGDEILVTNHGYAACNAAAEFVAQKTGARVVVAEIPFPLNDDGLIEQAILNKVSARTRLAMLDHVTSSTAVIFPVASLTKQLRQKNILVLIDGAHAPGMLPIDLLSLGATFYTGNCHKWLYGPKSSAFLYVDPAHQHHFHPLVISHGFLDSSASSSAFRAEFDWMGTFDPTPFLTTATGIRYFDGLVEGGWSSIYRHNHQLTIELQTWCCDELSIALPVAPHCLGSMASIPLPAKWFAKTPKLGLQMSQRLFDERRIEVPIFKNPAGEGWLLRVSCPLYLEKTDFTPLLDWMQNMQGIAV